MTNKFFNFSIFKIKFDNWDLGIDWKLIIEIWSFQIKNIVFELG